MDFEIPELPDEDEDDIDPFAALGIDSPKPEINEDGSTSPAKDALDALLEEDDEESLDDAIAEDNFFTAESSGDENNSQKGGGKAQPNENSLETYQLLLETVWVDDVLDPAEVALLARKREALGISFEQHIEVVRNIIAEDVE